MTDGDRPEFERLLSELFAALDKPLYESKREGFWRGLAKMSIVEFTRCRDLVLEELEQVDPPKTFGVSEVWAAKRRLRAKAAAVVGASRPEQPEPHYTPSQRFANRLLVDWLNWRCRQKLPAISSETARAMYAEARALADAFEFLRRENDPEATGRKFLGEFCDRVVLLASQTEGPRYHAYVLGRQRAAA
jgi:hypothetical protein